MIYGILIFLLILAVDLITDYRLWLGKKSPNHARGAVLRLIGLMPAIYFLGWYHVGYSSLIYLATLLVGFTWWLLFDGIFAVMMGRGFWYNGTTSAIDRMLNKIGRWKYVLKVVPFLAVLILYILKVKNII